MVNDHVEGQKATDVVITTWNRLPVFRVIFDRILERTTDPARFIAVDNLSTDGTWEWLREIKDDRVIAIQPKRQQHHFENLNFALSLVQSDLFVTTVDKAVVFEHNWIERLSEALISDPIIGAVMPCEPQVPGSRWGAWGLCTGLKNASRLEAYFRMQRRDDIQAAGGFRPYFPVRKPHSEGGGFGKLMAEIGKRMVITGDVAFMNLLCGSGLIPRKHHIFTGRYTDDEVVKWPIWALMEKFLRDRAF